MNCESQYIIMRDKMCGITDLSHQDFEKARRFPIAYYRAIVACALYSKGYSYIQIAKAMGKNHSTLVLICNKWRAVKDLMPYKDVKQISEKFHSKWVRKKLLYQDLNA